jgi:fucose permease
MKINADRRFAVGVVFAGFVVTGVVTTILGPALPILIGQFALDDARAGSFFTVQFLGSLLGVGLSTWLLAVRGFRGALFFGYALMALGIAALAASRSVSVALSATAIFGCGFGTVIPAANLWVAEFAGVRKAGALNLLNLAWGVGAVACPALVFAAVRSASFGILLYAIAAACALFCVLSVAMPMDAAKENTSEREEDSRVPAVGGQVFLALGVLFLLYVGTESGISGWVAAHARRVGAMPQTQWALAPMFFWAAMLTGRGLAPFVLLRIRERHLASLGLAAAVVGNAVLLVGTTRATLIAGILTAGLGLSSVYPIFIAWLASWYGERARRIGGLLFALAALGGATLPWLVGVVSTWTGSLRTGLLVPLVGCLAMLCVVLLLQTQFAKPRSPGVKTPLF